MSEPCSGKKQNMWLWPPRSTRSCTSFSTSYSVSPMPTMMWAPNFSGPKISFASSNRSQYFCHLCGDCTPLPRVRSNNSGVAASRATVKISAPRSLHFCTSSRVIVVGFDRIDTGMASGSIRSVHCSSTVKVSCSERGCVIIEMHMRWNGLAAGSLATMSMISAIGTAGQSTRMKLRSA